MKRWLNVTATAAIVLVAAYGAVRLAAARRGTTAPSEGARAVPRVAVWTVQRANLVRTIEATGQTAPLAEVTVIPKVTGRLDRFRLPSGALVEEGIEVRAGDVLATIEHAALAAAVDQAQAALDVARVAAADAEREKTRWDALFADKSATEQQRDKAATAFELARAQTAQAQAALRQARLTLDDATITAPIAGTVSRKLVDEGNMVGPGTPLVRIADIATIRLLATVGERHIASLHAGTTAVKAMVDAFPDLVFSGTVHRVGVALDPVTRTVEIEARLPNPDRRLKPGMFARTVLSLEDRRDVPVVPEQALLRADDRVYVYVVADSRVRQRTVETGLVQGDRCEILEGLAPGEVVVIRGQRGLHDGDAVEARDLKDAP